MTASGFRQVGSRRARCLRLGRSAWLSCSVVLLAAVAVAGGSAARTQALQAPSGLQAFDLRPGDTNGAVPTFSRTPSLAWSPVRGAARYQVQLSINRAFVAGSGVLWSGSVPTVPVASVPISLPWITKRTPGAFFWRVRAFAGDDSSPWSAPASFRMLPGGKPQRVESAAGYIRWSQVTGATSYSIWFVNEDTVVSTLAPSADLRDYFRNGAPSTVTWRVRAERRMYGSDTRTLPAVSYGPWSAPYTATVAPSGAKALRTVNAAADSTSARNFMPVFLFPGDRTALNHVYVTADSACRKVVLNSAVVRGGVWVPRAGQFAPGSRVQAPVNEGTVVSSEDAEVAPSELGPASGARVDLAAGRYFWTVVPVERRDDGSYRDRQTPEEACARAKGSFIKGAARPGLGRSTAPYASGLSPRGRLVSVTAPTVRLYGHPLVAWRPAQSATRYEVQWSRTDNPWRTVGTIRGHSTSVLLPAAPGTWWYRARGINGSSSVTQLMPWSAPVRVRVAAPTFSVIG